MTSPTGTQHSADDPRNADVLVHVDGRLVPRAEAVVSHPLDPVQLAEAVVSLLRPAVPATS